jgi:hypothetical protein
MYFNDEARENKGKIYYKIPALLPSPEKLLKCLILKASVVSPIHCPMELILNWSLMNMSVRHTFERNPGISPNGLHSKVGLQALVTNIKLGWNYVIKTNILSHYSRKSTMRECFIVSLPL